MSPSKRKSDEMSSDADEPVQSRWVPPILDQGVAWRGNMPRDIWQGDEVFEGVEPGEQEMQELPRSRTMSATRSERMTIDNMDMDLDQVLEESRGRKAAGEE